MANRLIPFSLPPSLSEASPHSLSSCPIAGEYTGVLPDAPSFCARMSSDCNNPDVMFFAVASCARDTEVFEGETIALNGKDSEVK